MYTERVVRLRSFALMLALLVAATPVVGILCAMDCEPPVAAAPSCHEASATGPQDAVTLRAVLHACDHDHTGGSPSVTVAGERDSAGFSVVAQASAAAVAIFDEAYAATTVGLHGPPGLTTRRSLARSTVLRI
jgi:hypothetical protein